MSPFSSSFIMGYFGHVATDYEKSGNFYGLSVEEIVFLIIQDG